MKNCEELFKREQWLQLGGKIAETIRVLATKVK
jgi:hypothetical protein